MRVLLDEQLDHRLKHNFSEINIAIIILSAKTNRYSDVAPLIAEIDAVLPTLQVGQILQIGKK